MKRRDLLSAIALSAAVEQLDAQEPGSESLYIPKAHRVEDRTLLHDFMDEFSFVDLVTASPTVRVTHIPTLLDRSAGTYGTVFGHIARNNPQYQTFDGRQPAVIVFRGPHAYISPSWYSNQQAVPTWNFSVVHASGKLKAITDKKALHALLGRLIKKFEGKYGGGSTYDFDKLPDSYLSGMLGNIVGFEMQVESLEGKFKLGQERNETDQASMLTHLSVRQERSIRDFTAGFYERVKKAVLKNPA